MAVAQKRVLPNAPYSIGKGKKEQNMRFARTFFLTHGLMTAHINHRSCHLAGRDSGRSWLAKPYAAARPTTGSQGKGTAGVFL